MVFLKKTKRTVLLRYGVGGCQACTGHGAGETVASGGNPGYRTALAASARLGAAGGWLRQQAVPARLLRHLPSVPPISPASARGRSAFPPREAAAHPAGSRCSAAEAWPRLGLTRAGPGSRDHGLQAGLQMQAQLYLAGPGSGVRDAGAAEGGARSAFPAHFLFAFSRSLSRALEGFASAPSPSDKRGN